jgi:hypothetical protein
VTGTVIPRHLAATALLTLASGFLYTWLEGHAFFVMALLCAAAVPLE